MAVVISPFERSLAQRLDALEAANAIRIERGRELRALKRLDPGASQRHAAALLRRPPSCLETCTAYRLLTSVRRVGPTKAGGILNRYRISATRTIGGLTERQRFELADHLIAESGADRGGTMTAGADTLPQPTPPPKRYDDGPVCARCGEHLEKPAELCGFCLLELERAA